LQAIIDKYDNNQESLFDKARSQSWLSLELLRQRAQPDELRKRIDTPESIKSITFIIQNYNRSFYYQSFLQRALEETSHGRERAHKEAWRWMDDIPSGYYSQAHADIGPMILESFVSNNTLALRSRMREIETPDVLYTQLLMEVIAPEFILTMIQQDCGISRSEARVILEDPRAMDYGRLVFGYIDKDGHITTGETNPSVQEYQGPSRRTRSSRNK
jgi:hypothetical protein